MLATLLIGTGCGEAPDPGDALSAASKQLSAANSWVRKANRELVVALRDSLNRPYADSLQYRDWADSIRISDVVVSQAQDRLATDLLVLERLLEKNREGQISDIIKQYWEADNRLVNLSTAFMDAFAYLGTSQDTILRYPASQQKYWLALGENLLPPFQWSGLRGASLELNVAYFNWLERFRQEFGLPPYPTGPLRLALAPKSRHLLAGDRFEADVWLAPIADLPRVNFQGPGISQDSSWSNEARITLLAGQDTIPFRQRWYQTFEVEASMFSQNGNQVQYFLKDSFLVSRPVIRWYGQRPTFVGVAHQFNVQAPVLGDRFTPSLDIEGGWIEEKEGQTYLIPNDPLVRIEVLETGPDGEVLLDTFRFVCQKPPRPHLNLLVNGTPYTGLTTIPKRSRLILQILPDDEFASNYPEDAQYGLDQVEVLVQVKANAPPRSILKFSGKGRSGSQGVPILLDEAPIPLRPGTVLHIRAENMFRRSAQGAFEYEDRFTERERTITVVLR